MCDGFIERGHTVFGCSRSPKAVSVLTKRYAPPHNFEVVDVANDKIVEAWAHRVLKEHDPPDLLLNNAALINQNAVLWQVPPADFSQIMDVNIKGVYHVIRHFVPAMVEAGRGVIVNFSSGWGRATSSGVAPYCATKWAIEGLTRALADELPAGMAAVPLNPGVIRTDMLDSCFGAGAAAYPAPAQWAMRAVPFLLELGPDHNGQPLTVTH
jgi:NAD(P)-dependent dehydrogenase (short-subunit alcohol dehydrogenase family)